jgi:hypothetical protein
VVSHEPYDTGAIFPEFKKSDLCTLINQKGPAFFQKAVKDLRVFETLGESDINTIFTACDAIAKLELDHNAQVYYLPVLGHLQQLYQLQCPLEGLFSPEVLFDFAQSPFRCIMHLYAVDTQAWNENRPPNFWAKVSLMEHLTHLAVDSRPMDSHLADILALDSSALSSGFGSSTI